MSHSNSYIPSRALAPLFIFVFIYSFWTKRIAASLTWMESTTEIPMLSPKHQTAVGVYNNSVWLLGGEGGSGSSELIEIDLVTETATHHSNSIHYSSYSAMYFQRGSVLFVADRDSPYIIGFDLRLQTQTYNISKYDSDLDFSLCIAANDDYLFTTGGQSYLNVYYIYNFDTTQWFVGPPMPTNRSRHSCNVLNASLYVIGGQNEDIVITDSVISIDVSDPYTGVLWTSFPDSLNIARKMHRSVTHETFIYIVGGKVQGSRTATVEIMDTVNGNILMDSSMKYSKYRHSIVVANGILFSFGGTAITNNAYYQFAVIPKRRVAPLTWRVSTFEIPMIASLEKMAVGAYNDSVWLLGGSSALKGLIEINLSSSTPSVTNHSDLSFSYDGLGQLYCQRGSVLWSARYTSSYIKGFDLRSQNETFWITKYNTVHDGGACLAANDHYLFVTGGEGPEGSVDAFYIYNFSGSQWFEGGALTDPRVHHSCAIVDSSLYVIGGFVSSTNQTNSVIFIDIDDPYDNAPWSVFPDTLYVARSQFRSTNHKEFIYVVGGWHERLQRTESTVELIDTLSGNIFIDNSMTYEKEAVGLVAVHNILFSFGGYPTTNNAYYQYAALPSEVQKEGIVITDKCVPFESVEYVKDTLDQSHQVGWIKVASCTDYNGDSSPASKDTFTYHYDDEALASQAISIKFQPNGGSKHANYNDFVTIAKVNSNPIQALNDYKELSYEYDPNTGNITGYSDRHNWITYSNFSYNLLWNNCARNGVTSPHAFDHVMFQSCGNFQGMHLIPNSTGNHVTLCDWAYTQELGVNVEILFGFVPQSCFTNAPTNSPTNAPSDAPSNAPTNKPTHAPTQPSVAPTTTAPSQSTNMPSDNPSSAPTARPSAAPSAVPTQPSVAPTQAPSFLPTLAPTIAPSRTPTTPPSAVPTAPPSRTPTSPPTQAPSFLPSLAPTAAPSGTPTTPPSMSPTTPPTRAPTSAPTLTPSSSPTVAPSGAPTSPPTETPSFSPSNSPTVAPSTVPTTAPSRAPTSAPTQAPSFSPTVAPSDSPTTPPSNAPTAAPSNAPSLAPSQAPTACVDYFNYTSLDGIDVINDIHSPRHVLYHNQSFPSSSSVQTHISTEKEEHFFFEAIECNNHDSSEDTCFIGCYGIGHCSQANIHCAPDTKWKEIRLICSKKACKPLTVNITDTKVDNLTILCDAAFACQWLEVAVHVASNINVFIDCNEFASCKDMVLDLRHNTYDDINVTITCYDDNSCDDLLITTDHSPNIFVELHAVRYSEHITIVYHFWENIKVHCGFDGDRRYVRYDTNHLLDDAEVLKLARYEYATKKLPCEDIRVFCSNSTHFERQCEYQYELRNVSLSDILKDANKPSCYWLDIGQLYKATCDGTCDDEMIYKKYNKTFDLDIIFDSNAYDDDDDDGSSEDSSDEQQRRLQSNENGTTKSYRVCEEYFGSVNATDDSLSSIDAVFYYVLNMMMSVDTFTIHDILWPPQTILRDNLEAINCEKKDKNIVKITTNVYIESAEYKEKIIDNVFDADSEFVNESIALLSQLFGIPIRIQSVHPSDINIYGVDKRVIFVIVFGAVCIIGSILLIVIRSRRRRRAQIEALTTYVQNPMVLFLGIAEYDDPPTNPAVDGYFRSLGGIDVDSRHVNQLFGGKLNYDVFPKQLKLHWTLKEVMKFLEDRAGALEVNIGGIYDGLIVILSCHGITDYIVTSDYKKIKKSVVHRIFTSKKPKNREIPRLFLFDCCDGEDDRAFGVTRTEEFDDTDNNKEVDVAVDNEKKVISNEETKTIQSKNQTLKRTYTKNVELACINPSDGLWLDDEDNPDFRLSTIHAANEGFQSKLNIVKGSYAITAFTEKMSANVDDGNKKWLFQICDDIQSDLHHQQKQHTVNTFNDNMRYLKFLKNGNLLQNTTVSYTTTTTETKGNRSARYGSDRRQTSIHNETKQFLGKIGLEEYYEEFESNGYNTIASLRLIDDDILTSKFKIASSAHREVILKAISASGNKANVEVVDSDSNQDEIEYTTFTPQ